MAANFRQYKRALDAANEEIRHLYSQQAADKAMVQAYKQELDQYKERFIAAAKNAVQVFVSIFLKAHQFKRRLF